MFCFFKLFLKLFFFEEYFKSVTYASCPHPQGHSSLRKKSRYALCKAPIAISDRRQNLFLFFCGEILASGTFSVHFEKFHPDQAVRFQLCKVNLSFVASNSLPLCCVSTGRYLVSFTSGGARLIPEENSFVYVKQSSDNGSHDVQNIQKG